MTSANVLDRPKWTRVRGAAKRAAHRRAWHLARHNAARTDRARRWALTWWIRSEAEVLGIPVKTDGLDGEALRALAVALNTQAAGSRR